MEYNQAMKIVKAKCFICKERFEALFYDGDDICLTCSEEMVEAESPDLPFSHIHWAVDKALRCYKAAEKKRLDKANKEHY
jgi:hypothetical protein